MNLRFIEAFVWVARLHSFKAAAEKLHMTQAAISSRIAALENQFGVRLFERDERNVVLTYSGSELLKYAEQLLGTYARMTDAVADRASFRGKVSIGVIESVVHTWLPDLLRRFREAYPQASVEIHSDNTPKVQEALLKGHIDLAFTTGGVFERTVENRRLCTFAMRWIASASLGLSKGPLGKEVFERYPILTFLRDSIVCIDVVSKLEGYGAVSINPCSSIAAMVSLVRSGFGIATLQPAAIQHDLAAGDLVALDLEPGLAPSPVVASLRVDADSPLAEPIVPFAREAVLAFTERFPASGVFPEA